MNRGTCQATAHGSQQSDTTEASEHTHTHTHSPLARRIKKQGKYGLAV